ncbi:MAG: glycosyl transferase group 1 [Mucilaginibacter sp.]|nr:glycosyl transferase group 1 [Mucilaginibacter sp.]
MIKSMIITDVDFWKPKNKYAKRLSSVTSFLIKHSHLSIILVGNKQVSTKTDSLPKSADILFLDNDILSDKEKNIASIKRLLEFDDYKICIIGHIYLSYFLQSIPEKVISILNAHEILSKKNPANSKNQYERLNFTLSKNTEYKVHELFTYVMFICKNDYENILHDNQEKILLIAHPGSLRRHVIKEDAKIIGFTGSASFTNIYSISWFLDKVWAKIPEDKSITLNIYGEICKHIPTALIKGKNVILRGDHDNMLEVYSEIDIAINPRMVDPDFSIKNIEILANGIPLITTTIASIDLEKGVESAFLIADKEIDFCDLIIKLINDYKARKVLSINAHEFINNNFDENMCFKELKEILIS